ncbi:hypothetical protein DM806_10245 [Sphingobium lactosutens]|uniref:TonB-dependent receptor n=1 Tax=Sphingobium lactosutens TaxID=522773 RepID=UPI0015B86F0D|nr:TonB-dependent receptor [Sphingobium lactosutens]NWK96049.1 hypothetical protein [Sphingobium lactosutens]
MKVSVQLQTGAALLAFAMMPMAAVAQDGAVAQPAVDDIVVTAQRREQRLQDVPLAVSAFNEASLTTGKVDSLVNLDGKMPNVLLAPVGAYPFASAFFIRGLGFSDVESSFEPSVGVELDGVYLSRNVGAVQDFFDVEGVTVLRGPQGTLYGRNTIGGVVSVRTKRPTGDFGVRAQGTLGSYGRREIRAAVEAPIVKDMLAAKVSVLAKGYDGYLRNEDGRRFGKQNVLSVRGTLAFTPSSNFDATLIGDYTRDRGTGPSFENASLPTMILGQLGYTADDDGKPYLTRVDTQNHSRLESTGVTLEMNWDLGPVKLTSISGYRDTDTNVLSDFDGENIPFLNVGRIEQHDQWSQEIRLGSTGKGPLTYVIGGYFMTQRYDIGVHQYGLAFGSPTAGSTLFAGQRAKAGAIFGQIDYEVIHGLTLTAGARYSDESKRFTIQPLFATSSQTFKARFDDFSPKFGISYAWTPDIMTYAQYSRGFRAGGFNGRAGAFTAVGPYKSENVDSYEAGIKTDLFNRVLRLNLAAFTTKYKNMQQSVQELIPGTNVNQTVVSNVGRATINGFEGEATLNIVRGFTLNGTLGYLDAGFDKFVANLGDGLGTIDRSNLPFAYAPKWSTSLTGAYKTDIGLGELTAQASMRHASKIYTSFTPLNLLSDLTVRPANTTVDASIGLDLDDGRWHLGLWGRNITDERIINNTFAVGNLMALRVYQPPREIGVDIGFKF